MKNELELPAALSPSLLTDLNVFGNINTSKNLNLFIGGMGQVVSNQMDLVLFNEQVVNTLNLYIRGLGITPNAHSISSILNLFLLRANPSEILTLFISGYDKVLTSELHLFIKGALLSDATINLSIPYVSGILSAKMDLYINGAP
jgi:hypothetical protein